MKLFTKKWNVAIRRTDENSYLPKNKDLPFFPVCNNSKYAAADPFLIRFNDEDYLFAEVIDNKTNKGKIGFIKLQDREDEWHIIIEEPYHLSYPNIFKYNNNYFIIPESSEANAIYVYKCIQFPNVWKKTYTLLEGKRCVDSTFFEWNKHHFMITYDIEDINNKKLWIYEIDLNGKLSLYIDKPISTDEKKARPGGNFFYENEKLIRVSQDCMQEYGNAIVFSEIIGISNSRYTERELFHIYPKDINIHSKQKIFGIHTYNRMREYEVIDYHVIDYRLTTFYYRVMNKLKRGDNHKQADIGNRTCI